MSKKISVVVIAGLLLVCCVTAAYADEKCNLRTMIGTYAFYEKGSNLIMDPFQQPYPFHWAPTAYATFANVAEITFKNGVGHGYYWIYIGALGSRSYDPYPVDVTITEMSPDCTGKMRYAISLPGIPSAIIEERIIVFDNGQEVRTVPTSIQNGIETLAWLGAGHRISKSSKPVTFCGQHTAHGAYVLSAENIIALDPTLAVADTLLIRQDVSHNGDYTGTLYEKIGPKAVQTQVLGTIKVNPDCSFTSTLEIPEFFPGVVLVGKGVFFNEGKEYYVLTLDDPTLPPDLQGIKFSFGYGQRASPKPKRDPD